MMFLSGLYLISFIVMQLLPGFRQLKNVPAPDVEPE